MKNEKFDFNKEQMKMCISCKYMKDNLKLYLTPFLDEDNPMKLSKEDGISIIKFLDIEYLCNGKKILDRIQNWGGKSWKEWYGGTAHEGGIDMCVYRMHEIVYALKTIWNKDFYNKSEKKSIEATSILKLILDKNIESNTNTKEEFERNTQSIDIYIQNQNSIFVDILTQKKGEQCILRDRMKILLLDYLQCDSDFFEFDSEKNNCFALLHRKILKDLKSNSEQKLESKKIKLAEYNDFMKRIDALEINKQKLLFDFMDKAPKFFGFNLTHIMDLKNTSEQKLLNLIKNLPEIPETENLKVSNIQSYMKMQHMPKENAIIEVLCRALLVEKELLCEGTGGNYEFTWQELFSEEFLKNSKKKEMEKDIRTFAIQSEEAYQKLLQHVQANSIEPVEISLYKDTKEQFNNLLEPNSLYALLNVLENN